MKFFWTGVLRNLVVYLVIEFIFTLIFGDPLPSTAKQWAARVIQALVFSIVLQAVLGSVFKKSGTHKKAQ